MKAFIFLTRFLNCKSEDELLSIILSSSTDDHQLNPLTLLSCLRDNCTNQQVYFERFLLHTPSINNNNNNIHGLIAECYLRAEDGAVQWDKPQYVMLDDLEVSVCECNQKTIHSLLYGDDDDDDDGENHL